MTRRDALRAHAALLEQRVSARQVLLPPIMVLISSYKFFDYWRKLQIRTRPLCDAKTRPVCEVSAMLLNHVWNSHQSRSGRRSRWSRCFRTLSPPPTCRRAQPSLSALPRGPARSCRSRIRGRRDCRTPAELYVVELASPASAIAGCAFFGAASPNGRRRATPSRCRNERARRNERFAGSSGRRRRASV